MADQRQQSLNIVTPPVSPEQKLVCRVCGAMLKISFEGETRTEYTCSTLGAKGPVIKSDYRIWKDHFLASQVWREKKKSL